jgi:hypothetical protein
MRTVRAGCGRGSNLSDGRVSGVTTDFAVRDAHVRLAPDLADIPLVRAEGRLRYRDEGGVTKASGKRLSLQTSDGMKRLQPTDFFLRLEDRRGSAPARGEFVASQLDLDVLSRLAGRLPVAPALRQRLAAFAPAGNVAPLSVKWSADADELASYSVDARFVRLGIEPVGAWPGFSGLSGRIEGTERGGRFSLTGQGCRARVAANLPRGRACSISEELAAEGSMEPS